MRSAVGRGSGVALVLLAALTSVRSEGQSQAASQTSPVAFAPSGESVNGSQNAKGTLEGGTAGAGYAGTGESGNQGTSQQNGAAESNENKPIQPQVTTGVPVKAATLKDQRKAAKYYLQGVKLLEKQQPEAAWHELKQAADLEPFNGTYATASELARQSAVTQLVEKASQAQVNGATADATSLLRHALEVDPKSDTALAHLKQYADQLVGSEVGATASGGNSKESEFHDVSKSYSKGSVLASGPIELAPTMAKQSFHIRSDAKQVIQQVFQAYGIEASIHDSVPNKLTRLDLDDVSFADAAQLVGMLTGTFYEALDPHRALVAKDTRANRTEFERLQMETIYLPGLTDKQLTDVSNIAHTVFDAQHAVTTPSTGTMTISAPAKTLAAFNDTVGQLEDGRNQLVLNVKIIQLAHVTDRETGTTFFQQTGVYNAFSEIQSVLSQNQSLVQQVIASGLVANQSTLANQIEILAILVASGQVTGTPFNQGFLPFGGGLTQSLLVPGPATLTLSLNSSDTRTLDDINLRLEDDEKGTFKSGMRYPIEQSSFSSVALPAALSAVLGSNAAAQTIPQIQYEDLGLVLEATPKVMRSNDVALSIKLKIESLGGSSLDNIPILDSQQFEGVLTLQAGETAVLMSDLSRSESRALNGLPGIGDIPGLQDISDITKAQNVARLMILVTPTVVRSPRNAGHGPLLMVDKATH